MSRRLPRIRLVRPLVWTFYPRIAPRDTLRSLLILCAMYDLHRNITVEGVKYINSLEIKGEFVRVIPALRRDNRPQAKGRKLPEPPDTGRRPSRAYKRQGKADSNCK